MQIAKIKADIQVPSLKWIQEVLKMKNFLLKITKTKDIQAKIMFLKN